MMHKKQTIKGVSGLVRQVLKDPLFSGVTTDSIIRQHWESILGSNLSARIEFIGIQGETILISVPSAAFKNEFMFQQGQILESIRALVYPQKILGFTFC